MDSSTADENAVHVTGPRHAAPPTQSLGGEVRATLILFAMVVLVTLGFGLASTLALRLLAS
jgi:hypothetical protein